MRITETLRGLGYTTIERAWVNEGGWFGSGATFQIIGKIDKGSIKYSAT